MEIISSANFPISWKVYLISERTEKQEVLHWRIGEQGEQEEQEEQEEEQGEQEEQKSVREQGEQKSIREHGYRR